MSSRAARARHSPAKPESVETRSGLDPWIRAELPVPPNPRGVAWFGAVGPGVIVLGASIGSGEFLLGPAAFVKYGLSLLWIVGIAAVLQTLFNLELMRYTMATGEPVITGFMRTRPTSTFWGWFYTALYFLQLGWPAWAGAAAGAMFFLFTGRLAADGDGETVYWLGAAIFLACAAVLCFGRRIEHTLEILNWILVAAILSAFTVLCVLFVAPHTWVAALAGFIGLDPATGTFSLLPKGADFFLLGAFAGFAGAGGVANLTLSNWARDKGYGMSRHAGYISAAVGPKVRLAHSGSTFMPDAQSMARWRGWWRIAVVDQWGVYFGGVLLGMVLPGMLYVTFLDSGEDIRGLGIAAALAQAMSARAAVLGILIALMGVWILVKTQLDLMEGIARTITDILWTGSRALREWRGGDVRVIYYCVLAAEIVWGLVALRLTQPIVLLQIAANMAGMVFVIAAIHLLYVNNVLLPKPLRPPLWRSTALVALALFYGSFVTLWLTNL
jgi:hypothetical protein